MDGVNKTLLTVAFFALNSVAIGFTIFLLSPVFPSPRFDKPTKTAPIYGSFPQVLGAFSAGEIYYSDGRGEIVKKFLTRYNSPFSDLGYYIVETADKYNLPYGIVPAIAQCESNVGKVIPPGSYNAWGWHIYGDNKRVFDSWEHGIETVAKGLRKNYYNKGLDTPEEIMRKYTPSSNGSWAKCVNQYLAELR